MTGKFPLFFFGLYCERTHLGIVHWENGTGALLNFHLGSDDTTGYDNGVQALFRMMRLVHRLFFSA